MAKSADGGVSRRGIWTRALRALLGDLLLESQFVYSGQGYCVALASIGTAPAAERLTAYLDRWLPDIEARYDQWWAMAALVTLDRRSGVTHSDRFLGADGPWETCRQGRLDLEDQVNFTQDLLATLSRGPRDETSAHAAVRARKCRSADTLSERDWGGLGVREQQVLGARDRSRSCREDDDRVTVGR